MELTIKRTETRADALSGTLYIKDQYICDTEENIHTALPAGKYRIVRHHCKQYHRFMPLIASYHPESQEPRTDCDHCQQLEEEEISLNTVLPCHCPMLKPGNGVHHRKDGSIILGIRIVTGCLTHPLQAFTPLAERIRKAIKREQVIRLVIQDSLTCHPE
jgi:hypothetical protein